MALSFSPKLKRQLENIVICLALGSLGFVLRWYDLEHLQSKGLDYYRGEPPPAHAVLFPATLIASILLALIFRLGWAWVEWNPTRLRRTFGHSVFLMAMIYPLECVRRYWNMETQRFDLGANLALLFLELMLAAGIVLRFRGSERIVRAARSAALLMSLLVPVVVFDFGIGRLTRTVDPAFHTLAAAPMLPARSEQASRVLWLLFDEFDQRMAFDQRPDSVDLPELDRLRSQSVMASHMTQTGNMTVLAVPSLLGSHLLSQVQVINANTLLVKPEADPGTEAAGEHSWRDQPNVFMRARKLGVNAEIVGWYHPYCRVLGDQVVRCQAFSSNPTPSLELQAHAVEKGRLGAVGFLFRLQIENLIAMFRSTTAQEWLPAQEHLVQRDQQQQYFSIRDLAFQAAADPKIGFAYIHFPTPHLLPIYNRRTRSFKLDDGAALDYLDNLALVDRTVGEIRGVLEKSGLWARTTVLVSSDHGLRSLMWQVHGRSIARAHGPVPAGASNIVPFIVKLAGQSQPASFDRDISAVVTGDLALAVLSGEVKTAADASRWLDARATGGSPSARAKR
jgi:hypothetical protein